MFGIFRKDTDDDGWVMVATADSPELAFVIVRALHEAFPLAVFSWGKTYSDLSEV